MKVLMLANNMMSDAVMTAALAAAGCNMVQTESVENAVALLAANEFDVVVVDVRPDLWGHQAICKLRVAQVELPVLFVSARSTADAVQRAYDVGADDVVTLPIDQQQFKARLTSLARRRTQTMQTESVSVGPLEIGLIDHDARIDGKPILLSADEHRALQLLASNTHDPSDPTARRGADATIARLRRKLTRAGAGDVVQSVRGLGYRLGAGCIVNRRGSAALRHAA
jgi:DNA-binding response OmpR family regulator